MLILQNLALKLSVLVSRLFQLAVQQLYVTVTRDVIILRNKKPKVADSSNSAGDVVNFSVGDRNLSLQRFLDSAR